MPTYLHRWIHVLSLVRADLALVAVSNSWLMVFLARYVEPGARVNPSLSAMPLPVALGVVAVVAAGLFAYGAAINDGLDSRHDSAFWPRRPIPAGRMTGSWALVVAIMGLLSALAAAVCLGKASSFLCVVAAAAILFYNTAGKFVPAVGIVLVGLIHALNMWIVNPRLGFAWPIWLNMTHVIAAGAIAHRLESKRPRLRAGQVAGLWAGWSFWTMALVASMGWRGALLIPAYPKIGYGPVVVAVLFVAVAAVMLRRRMRPLRSRREAGAGFRRLSLQWLILYDASWLAGGGLHTPAAVLVGLFVVLVACIAGLELLDQCSDQPVKYGVEPVRSYG